MQPVTLTGYIRFPEAAGTLTPPENIAKRLWFTRDHLAMARALGWGGKVAPFYIDLEQPVPASGIPKPGPLEVHLKDDHLQYAITWFGLAGAVVIAFAVWLRAHRRASDPGRGSGAVDARQPPRAAPTAGVKMSAGCRLPGYFSSLLWTCQKRRVRWAVSSGQLAVILHRRASAFLPISDAATAGWRGWFPPPASSSRLVCRESGRGRTGALPALAPSSRSARC